MVRLPVCVVDEDSDCEGDAVVDLVSVCVLEPDWLDELDCDGESVSLDVCV